jgi:hypothetical protein
MERQVLGQEVSLKFSFNRATDHNLVSPWPCVSWTTAWRPAVDMLITKEYMEQAAADSCQWDLHQLCVCMFV